MAARWLILLALTLQAALAWSGPRAALGAADAARAGRTHACGASCCCPPDACPCLAPTPGPEETPAPALPASNERVQPPRMIERSIDLALLTLWDVPREGEPVAWRETPAACVAPGRRIQQFQCVWTT